ncbi:MAG: hypothetical protein ACR2N8_02725, partial [Parvibaculales bacterium]
MLKKIQLFCLFLSLLFSPAWAKNERTLNAMLAKQLQGKAEVRHYYKDKHSIIIDIETDEFVIEAGLDKRSSLDSIQQALFASHLTGKKPLIIIYNTDNKIG